MSGCKYKLDNMTQANFIRQITVVKAKETSAENETGRFIHLAQKLCKEGGNVLYVFILVPPSL